MLSKYASHQKKGQTCENTRKRKTDRQKTNRKNKSGKTTKKQQEQQEQKPASKKDFIKWKLPLQPFFSPHHATSSGDLNTNYQIKYTHKQQMQTEGLACSWERDRQSVRERERESTEGKPV